MPSKRLFFPSGLTVALLAAAAAHLMTGQAVGQGQTYVYSVKYLCSNLEPFPTVFHWTDINIHNPSKTRVARLTKKFLVSGTQQFESSVVPVREQFELKPNQAISISCDEVQNQLGVPLSTPMEGFVEIESDLKIQVVGVYDKCVPFSRSDVFMSSVVRTDLEIGGLQLKQLELKGPTVVQKQEMQIGPGNTFQQATEIVFMELEGEIEMDGQRIPIRLIESPEFQSEGRIIGEVDPSSKAPLYPARSYFDIFFQITSADPGFQERFGRLFNEKAVRVEAAISGIPPGRVIETIGPDVDLKRLRRLFPDGDLVEAAGGLRLVMPVPGGQGTDDPINQYCQPQPTQIFSARSPAQPVGQVSNHCHDPNPMKTPPPPEHAKVPCQNASIDVEYIQPMELRGKR